MKAGVGAKAKEVVLGDYVELKETDLLSFAVLPILPFREFPMQ